MKHLALLLFVLGCQDSKKQPPPTAEPARSEMCASALVTFDRFVDTGDPNAPPEQRTKVKAAVLERCISDNWSDTALACMRAAGTSHDVFKCWSDQLTKEQREAASKSLGTLKQ
jgi:hypothetical protein